MTIRWYAGLAASATVLVAGLAATPASAAAESSTADSAKLAAGTLKDPETGKNRTYPAGQGEDVPVVLGVTNVGDAPVDGLVVQVRVLNDLDLTTKYENCWYAVDSNQETAWCEFDADLAPGASLAVTGAGISTSPDARAEDISSVVYWWMSKQHADAQGGIQALADKWAGQGTKAVRGTGDLLPLTTPSGELGGIGGPLGFAGVELVTPPTGEPTATPTPSATPSAAPTAAPSVSAGAGGEGGGLPVTGAGTATVAGVGGVLLLLGGAGFLIARRRRTRFVA
ncbi:LPXTG cell wall anchor domain-containing protein [Micromonospora sp. NPDC050187]|uniref:LPXTG cell wall anchor domain-containing protein n=1 Tax=Micromonospora sp. NPDC050187 TaxID=3364277 RepID=UPI0037987AB7